MNVLFVLTSIVNALVLVSIWRTPSLHSPSNVLLFGLAVSDMGVGFLVGPSSFVAVIAKTKDLALVFCISTVILSLAGGLLLFASLATITAISLDLYPALYLHLRYREIVTVKKMTVLLVGIWACAVVLINFAKRLVRRKSPSTLGWYYCIVRAGNYNHLHQGIQNRSPPPSTDSRPHNRRVISRVIRRGNDHRHQTSIAQQRKSLVSKFLILLLTDWQNSDCSDPNG